jgi:hypothetical protein
MAKKSSKGKKGSGKKDAGKKKDGKVSELEEDIPDEIIPQLVCGLEDISFVLLILYSDEEYPNKELVFTIINIGIEVFLTTNKSPLDLGDSNATEQINKGINKFKETDIYKYIKEYVEPYKKGGEGDLREGLKTLYLLINSILNFFKLYSKNDGKSKIFTSKLLSYIAYIVKSVFNSIYNTPVLHFTGEFGKIFFNFLFPIPDSKSCGGSSSLHPVAIFRDFIGDDICKSYEDEITQMICKNWAALSKTKLEENMEHILNYSTKDRSEYFNTVMEISMQFLQQTGEHTDSESIISEKIQELKQKQICTKNPETQDIIPYICTINDESEEINIENEDQAQTPTPTPTPTPTSTLTPTPTPVSTGGGNKNIFYSFSNEHIDKRFVYHNINHFTDVDSLKGIYMLHQYNKYLGTN